MSKVTRIVHASINSALRCSIILLLLTGCGYTIQGRASLPFPSVSIDRINNMTYEPKIDDRMREILTEELIRRGFVVDHSSDYKISGNLNSFELRTLSERAGVAVEYEVVIRGEFNLRTPSGAVKNLRSEGPFIVSFSSAERLQDVMALKEKAIEKALRDLSQELITSMRW
ncbi:MAG: LPS assembly lipoprotein LptE [Thermodesulfovibrionales bacterium]